MSTIFDSVVTKENDHTHLLRNIMEQYPRAAAAILSHLIEQPVSPDKAASFKFSTQCSFYGVNGREVPDLRVEGHDFHCIIEAKIDSSLDLSEAQKRGYRACLPHKGECHLSFLVPDRWKHSVRIQEIRAALPDTISIHLATWRDLICKMENIPDALNDPILAEAINFWKSRFQGERMTPEERATLNKWSQESYSAIRKLEKTIALARGLFDSRNADIQTELEASDIEGYGFYIKQGRWYILWVGIWTKSPTPLSFGFHSINRNWCRPNVLPNADSTAHDHHLWRLEPEVWDDSEKLYTAVNSFLQPYLVRCNQ